MISRHYRNKIKAILKTGEYETKEKALEHLDEFRLLEYILSYAEYGYYVFDKKYKNDFAYDHDIITAFEDVQDYIDFKRFGKTALENSDSYMTKWGLLERI
jgi:hypothetical protein